MKKKTKLPWKFFIANTRKKLWKDNRQMMERIRQNATDRAKQIKHDKHRNLVRHLYNWPAEFTSNELKQYIHDLNYVNKRGNRMLDISLINRLRSKKLIQYDTGLGVWKNLTKLT